MLVQTHGHHQTKNPTPYGYSRHIPRSHTGNRDHVARLWRMAEANNKRIRGMQSSVSSREDREALKHERQRLVEILNLAPWAVPTGAFEIIESAMAKARSIYAGAAKASAHPRRGERPAEKKRCHRQDHRSGERTREERKLETRKRGSDPIADAFQAELDASMIG